MATFEQLQKAPDRAALGALAEALEPGSSVVRVARLVGGMDNGLHRLRVERRDGSRHNVLLRRYGQWPGAPTAEQQARTEWRVLELLAELGVPAQEPLLEDAAGRLVGHPAIVTSFLPGKPQLVPVDPESWIRDLALALVRLHAATGDGDPRLAFLRDANAEWSRIASLDEPPGRLAEDRDVREMWRALRRHAAVLERAPSRLIHSDFWPGNTIWAEGRLTGIIDWGSAARGNPAYDVAYLRLDLSITGRFDEADRVLEIYEQEAGAALEDLGVYELLAALRAAPDPAIWLAGWNDLGDLGHSPDEVRENYRRKVAAILSALD